MTCRKLAPLLLLIAACAPEEDVLTTIREGGLSARVVDTFSGEPIAGATVLAGDRQLQTDEEGVFTLEAPLPDRLAISAGGYLELEARAPQLIDADELPRIALLPDRELAEEELREISMHGTGHDGPDEGPVALENAETPGALTLGGNFSLPARIRVGRTFVDGGGCPAVRAVEELDLEEYVKGAVTAEIGVFRSTTGGGDSVAMESYKTLAVAARSYALYFYLLDPRGRYSVTINGRTQRYHINDTACHQRYDDPRHGAIDRAVEATRGEILVDAGGATIDKYEYAASCGRHGTRPEHRTALVSDRPGVVACVGQWCGHNTCAAHEGCVVRGICQWGSLERAKRGDGYEAILAHYQPELEHVRIGAPTNPPPPPNNPPPPPGDAIVVDDEDGARFRASSSWSVSSWASGKIGAGYRWRNPAELSDPASYKVAIPTAGRYEVFARVPGNGYNTMLPYIVHHAGGRTVVHRDISARGAEWVSLGTFDFEAKDDWIIQISCWTGGSGYVIADAVRFVRR